MRSFEGSNGATLAIARERDDQTADAGAEIIDLVQLPTGARPTPFAELEYQEVPRARALDCDTYNACLSLAAHVRWAGFHCRRCPKYLADHKLAVCAEPGQSSPIDGPDAAIIRLR